MKEEEEKEEKKRKQKASKILINFMQETKDSNLHVKQRADINNGVLLTVSRVCVIHLLGAAKTKYCLTIASIYGQLPQCIPT